MLSAFSALSFTNLAGFFLAAGLPLLVLAYLNRKPNKRRVVSSVLLLQQLPKRPTFKRRIKLPLRFFLELAALLLLVGAITAPVITDSADGIAILVDNSLSMKARTTGETRLTQAGALARDALADYSDARFTVYQSAPQHKVVGDERVSLSDVSGIIAEIKPFPGSDSLEASIEDLARSGEYKRVIVITDRPGELLDSNNDERASDNETFVNVLSAGESAANFYLSGLTLESYGTEQRTQLTGFAGYSGPYEIEATAELFGGTKSGGQVQIQALRSKSIRLLPEKSLTLSFELSDEERVFDVFKLEIRSAEQDAIAEDNIGWYVSGAADGSRLLVVTARAEDAKGLGRISGIQVETASPSEYASLTESALKNYSLLIFHHATPRSAPRVPSLFLVPPEENTLFPIRGSYEQPRITSWSESHPLTSYLRVPLLSPASAVSFLTPRWAQSIINSEAGSLLLAGESEGIRFVAVGFELLPFEGKDTPAASVLTLNIFNWLSGGSKLEKTPLTGSSVPLAKGSKWEIIKPSGETDNIDTSESDASALTLDEPGVYFLNGENSASGEQSSKSLAANVFFPEESQTYAARPFAVRAKIAHTELTVREKDTFLWETLLFIAVAFLVLDLLLRCFAGRREGA